MIQKEIMSTKKVFHIMFHTYTFINRKINSSLILSRELLCTFQLSSIFIILM